MFGKSISCNQALRFCRCFLVNRCFYGSGLIEHTVIAGKEFDFRVLFHHCGHFCKLLRVPDIILVAREKNVPCGFSQTLHKVLLPAFALGIDIKLPALQTILADEALYQLNCAIRGAIIKDQHLIWCTLLLQQRQKLLFQMHFSVIGGHDH